MPRGSTRWIAALLATFLLSLPAIGAFAPATAFAHAQLVGAEPSVDAQLREAPTRITASFTEPLNPELSYIEVLNGEGKRVDVGRTLINPDNGYEMSVGVQPDLEPGFYTTVWQSLSEVDGHLLRGSYPFTILNPDGSEPSGSRFTGFEVAEGKPTFGLVISRWLTYVAVFLIVGGLLYSLVVVPVARPDSAAIMTARRHVYATAGGAAIVLILSGVAELYFETQKIGGLSEISHLMDTTWGERWWQRELMAVIAGAVLLGAVYALSRRGREGWVLLTEALGLVAGLGYIMLLALISHKVSINGSVWAVTVHFFHLTTAAVWIGMLVQLGLTVRWSRRLTDAARLVLLVGHLQRFSAVAASCMLIVLATGVFNTFVDVKTVQGLVETGYGLTLVAKLVLVLVLLSTVGINALLLGPHLLKATQAADTSATWNASATWTMQYLGRLIAFEAAIAAGVIAVAAVLVQYPTARQEADAAEFAEARSTVVVGYEDVQRAGNLSVNLSVVPNIAGKNAFAIFIFPLHGEELSEVLQVRMRFTPPDPDRGPSQVIAWQEGPNWFRALGAYLNQPGDWNVRVDLRRRGELDVSTNFIVSVIRPGGITGDRLALPLVAGSWAIVAGAGILLLALVLALGFGLWPELRESARRLVLGIQFVLAPLGVALIALAAFGIIGSGPEGNQVNPVEATEASLAKGETIYVEHCVSCHGLDGYGDGPLASTLSTAPGDFRIHLPFHRDLFLFQLISDGFGDSMPAYASRLSEEDRWHVLNYLRHRYDNPDMVDTGQGSTQDSGEKHEDHAPKKNG